MLSSENEMVCMGTPQVIFGVTVTTGARTIYFGSAARIMYTNEAYRSGIRFGSFGGFDLRETANSGQSALETFQDTGDRFF